ncbi:LysR family transcriptional regulator [Pseudomonas rubra]|uniref:LysR family transcriptional regulator n=1 Tax=Pseudomonas rubra TaxID=2942627 RepID=A0ABT5PAA3_9PSED|nr:LysR family transcriptional regulator [Pseudomonas rubra]MDD1015112.1 LysR family transcriptional regulator [Pseudomonas rubra]MDD1037691.1 LysR family transcriptional regulator [Pseudomonas rubra]MDD1157389.1 LysR family transcriptional regulator [Pseudomonas rubra]
MVSLDRFELFCAVVQAGSFTGAAERLQQTRAAVSFSIKQLEAELGVTLLTRTTRSIALTQAGERFYQRCLQVVEDARLAIDEARAEHGGLQGSLRITSTVEYGLKVLAPALQAFCHLHPELSVRLETHTAQVDLVRERFDVAIRLGQAQDSHYRGVCLATYDVRLVLAPSLLAAHGPRLIDSPGHLAKVAQLVHSRFEQNNRWTLLDSQARNCLYAPQGTPLLVADNASILRAFALQGAGVALLPDWLVADDLASGQLLDALPGYRFAPQTVYALYPSSRHVPRKVRAWIDFIKAYLAKGFL